MKDEKSLRKPNKKVSRLEINNQIMEDPEIDRLIRDSLIQEADEIEASLNSDPALIGVGASDDLFDSIVNKLKEEGVWEEEPEEDEKESVSSQPEFQESETDDIYARMTDEDREALELGRKIRSQQQEKEKRKQRSRGHVRRLASIAAILVIVVSVGLSSDASRRLILKVWDMMIMNFGSQMAVDNTGEGDSVRSTPKKELEAIKDISDRLGIEPFDFGYLPEGMRYHAYTLMDDKMGARICYEYQGEYFYVDMIALNSEAVSYFAFDETKRFVENVRTFQDFGVEIWENLPGEGEDNIYLGKFEYNDCCYVIYGKIQLEEMRKILKYMVFL